MSNHKAYCHPWFHLLHMCFTCMVTCIRLKYRIYQNSEVTSRLISKLDRVYTNKHFLATWYVNHTQFFIISEVGPFLLYTTMHPWPTILGRKLDPEDNSRNEMVQLTGSRDLYDIDFDMRDGVLYWTEARDHEHQRDRALVNMIICMWPTWDWHMSTSCLISGITKYNN